MIAASPLAARFVRLDVGNNWLRATVLRALVDARMPALRARARITGITATAGRSPRPAQPPLWS